MSWTTSCASEDAKDPIKNIAMPMSRMIFRDQMSESRPYRSWKEVDVLHHWSQ